MKLPPAWEAIVDEIRAAALQRAKLNNLQILDQGAVRDAVERCFALANKPQRELTAEEMNKAYWAGCEGGEGHERGLRAVIAAYQRKQTEPETVTFRAARRKEDGVIAMERADSTLHFTWEWLEPAQTIEVKV